MIVQLVKRPCIQVPEIDTVIERDITNALQSIVTTGNSFIVNDTPWFKFREGKVTPCVMNSANFLSKTFQTTLVSLGWEKERELEGQKIDAYLEVDFPGHVYQVKEIDYLPFLNAFMQLNPTANIDDVSHTYHKNRLFSLAHLDPSLHHFFTEQTDPARTRIGVEFETGNIASSFRALTKLNYLSLCQAIDVAVFITSHDKATTACRIWPQQNRNGSFEELNQRRYELMLFTPSFWAFSFQPDGFDQDAQYLSNTGTLYTPESTGGTTEVNGATFDDYVGFKRARVLKAVCIQDAMRVLDDELENEEHKSSI